MAGALVLERGRLVHGLQHDGDDGDVVGPHHARVGPDAVVARRGRLHLEEHGAVRRVAQLQLRRDDFRERS